MSELAEAVIEQTLAVVEQSRPVPAVLTFERRLLGQDQQSEPTVVARLAVESGRTEAELQAVTEKPAEQSAAERAAEAQTE